jgi:cytochrome bd-type quinol oxidase subunit 2
MTLADYSMIAFALLNGGRTVAYVPQMVRVYRDPHDAAAVSLVTWVLFAAANIATVCYALTASNDRIMAIMFSFNAISCLAIVALTAYKRTDVARRATLLWHSIASLRYSQEGVQAGMFPQVRPPHYGGDYSPSAQYRDEMIRQGLMS